MTREIKKEKYINENIEKCIHQAFIDYKVKNIKMEQQLTKMFQSLIKHSIELQKY